MKTSQSARLEKSNANRGKKQLQSLRGTKGLGILEELEEQRRDSVTEK